MIEAVLTPERTRAGSAIGRRPVYLDHHSTTPVDERVARVVLDAMTRNFGNSNSVDHVFGERAADLLDRARADVTDLVGADGGGMRFTSGSTEAIRLAIQHAIATNGRRPLKVAASRAEHLAVLDALRIAERDGRASVSWIEVDGEANVVEESVKAVLEDGVDLVCLMAANNEVGTLYPVSVFADMCHCAGARILVDATQSAGRTAIDVQAWKIDYLTLSAHKMYGPKGVGALVSCDPNLSAEIRDLVVGHDGTLNVPGIAGFGEACRLMRLEAPAAEPRIATMRDLLQASMTAALPDLRVNGLVRSRLSHNLHVSMPGVPNGAVVARLRNRVAISTGAACSSGAEGPSHVLKAMGLSEDLQEGALRIGVGRDTTLDEIDIAALAIVETVDAVRMSLAKGAS